jgi:hypothetical protein
LEKARHDFVQPGRRSAAAADAQTEGAGVFARGHWGQTNINERDLSDTISAVRAQLKALRSRRHHQCAGLPPAT